MEAQKAETTETSPASSFDMYNALDWLHRNRKQATTAAVIVAALGLAVGLFAWKKGQNELNANEELFALPAVYGLGEKVPHPAPEALLKVAQDYPSTSVGEQSQLLAAGEFFANGKYSDAEREFSKFLSEHGQSVMAGQASIGVAASLEGAGKTQEALDKYRDVIAKYPTENVASSARLSLGRIFEEQNKPSQALEYYDQIIKSSSAGQYNPWIGEATERKSALLMKHPELQKSDVIQTFSVTTPPAGSTNAPVVTPGTTKPATTAAPAPKASPAPTESKPK